LGKEVVGKNSGAKKALVLIGRAVCYPCFFSRCYSAVLVIQR
jgi:hypothetical protein